jgi:hypothetical protein
MLINIWTFKKHGFINIQSMSILIDKIVFNKIL